MSLEQDLIAAIKEAGTPVIYAEKGGFTKIVNHLKSKLGGCKDV